MLPYPARQVFAGRVIQSVNVIEVMVIQLLPQWLEGGLDVAKIHDPALLFVDSALYMDRYPKGMTMQATAFVFRWDIWQSVSCFNRELLEYFHLTSL